MSEASVYKTIYDSALHHPLVCYLAGLVFLLWFVRRLPFLDGYTVSFLVCILADATVTGSYSPVPSGTLAYTAFSITFIILGDFRYFLLCERVSRPADSLAAVLRFALPVSFLIPVATGILHRTVPVMADDRVLYAVYESAMVGLIFWLAQTRFSPRPIAPEVRSWLRAVHLLFAGLYAGWAACDWLILAGVEFAHLLRIVPNVLYYAVFVPFVFARAPASQRALAPA